MSIYNGQYEGVENLVDGYEEYAKEVIQRRSLPDLRDGLKPVQRRIMFKMNDEKMYKKVKSTTAVGPVMSFHPHGDGSIIEAMYRMVDRAEYVLTPPLSGQGSFGKPYMAEGGAAARYTEVYLNDFARTFFDGLDFVEWEEAEVGHGVMEPKVLPVRFPYILTAGVSGIAVSVSTKIPSFNFWDIIDLEQTYLKNGSFGEKVIYPDFPTGGKYILNTEEAMKIMLSGRGRYKLRASVEIDGRDIVVTEVPYGITTNKIVEKVNKLEIKGVSDVRDATGFETGGRVVITCKSKAMVEAVLLDLYRTGVLQINSKTNIMATLNDKTVAVGVYKILEEWTKWRAGVVKKRFEADVKSIKAERRNLWFFVELCKHKEIRDEFLNILVNKGIDEASKKLSSIFGVGGPLEVEGGIGFDEKKFICDRRAYQFKDGGKYLLRYERLGEELKVAEKWAADPKGYIYEDLENLKKEFKGKFQRKTEISNVDYMFTKSDEKEGVEVDTNSYWYTWYADGFLSKTSLRPSEGFHNSPVRGQWQLPGNGVLVGFDNAGQLLRVYGDEIPKGDEKTYLPRYFGMPEVREYQILYLGELDGTKRTLLYTDGYVGVLDTSEFLGAKKHRRVLQNGVNFAVNDKLLDVIEEKNRPECILLASIAGGKLKTGWFEVEELKEKGRMARTKAVEGENTNIQYWGGMFLSEVASLREDYGKFRGKFRKAKLEDFDADPSGYLNEPTYAVVG